MTWSIQEGYLATAVQSHTVSTDMLGNTTRLTGNHIGIADIVEQRGLTVVNVTHHGYDWSTWNQVVLIILFLAHSLLNLSADIFGLESELLSHHVDGLCIQTLVDRYHDTNTHQGRDNLSNADVHHRSQLANGNEFSKLQSLAVLLLLTSLILQFLLNSLTLLLTVFSALLVLALAGQTSKSLLYLACYSLVVNFYLTLVVLTAALVIILVLILFLLIATILVVLVAPIITLVSLSIDINTFFIDTHAFLSLTVLLRKFFLTFLAAFLLTLLLRTSTLIQGRQIDLTQHLRFIGRELLLTLEGEHASRSICFSWLLALLWLIVVSLILH